MSSSRYARARRSWRPLLTLWLAVLTGRYRPADAGGGAPGVYRPRGHASAAAVAAALLVALMAGLANPGLFGAAGHAATRPAHAAAVQIGLSSSSLGFETTVGTNPACQNVTITNTGDYTTFTWTATPAKPWITVNPGSGPSGNAVSVCIAQQYLEPGVYLGSVSVTTPGAPDATIAVTLTLDPVGVQPCGSTNHPPTACFTPTTASVTVGQSVTLTSCCTDPDNDALSLSWTWGDGATATGASVSHAYSATGTYTVTLTANDGRGGTSSTSGTITVGTANRPPVACFSPTTATAVIGQTVTLTSCSTDPDNDPLTYSWTWGDGGTSTGASASHAYAARGTFTVSLTANDGHGGTNSTGGTVTVVNQAPTARLTASPNPTDTATAVAFNGSTSSDPDGDTLTYSWAFGDGATGSGVTTSHRYAAGTFTATLTVNDGHGGTNSASTTVTVNGPAGKSVAFGGSSALQSSFVGITGAFTIEAWVYPNTGSAGGQQYLMNRQNAPGILYGYVNGTVEFFVNFGGGLGSGTDFRPYSGVSAPENTWTHVAYTYDGATFRVYRNCALQSSASGAFSMSQMGTWTIGAANANQNRFNGNLDEVRVWSYARSAAEISATCRAPVASPPSTLEAWWRFDDNFNDSSGKGRTATVIVGAPSFSTNIPFGNRAPTARFTASPNPTDTATAVAFNGSTSSDPDGDVLTYSWAFGDGATGSGVTTSHRYAAGTFTATLTVNDGHGGSNSTSTTITVTAPGSRSLAFGGSTALQSNFVGITGAFTIEAWVYPNTGSAGGQQYLMNRLNAPGILYGYVNGTVEFFVNFGGGLGSGTDFRPYSGVSAPENTWTHVAYTYDGATFRVYRNCALLRSASGAFSMSQMGTWAIGAANAYQNRFNGNLDEVRVWSYARSAAEISATCRAPVASPPSTLEAWWQFDNNLNDSSGKGRTATVTAGSPIYSTNKPF